MKLDGAVDSRGYNDRLCHNYKQGRVKGHKHHKLKGIQSDLKCLVPKPPNTTDCPVQARSCYVSVQPLSLFRVIQNNHRVSVNSGSSEYQSEITRTYLLITMKEANDPFCIV